MAKFFSKVNFILVFLWAVGAEAAQHDKLDFGQSQAFRSWFIRIIKDQVSRGPSPRWTQKDCSSLIRFAAYEALRKHDKKWMHASGTEYSNLPPEVALRPNQEIHINNWNLDEKSKKGSFVSALGIIQQNADFISKDINQAKAGDLLFFDQGEDQHLMVWMGSYVAYHTGSNNKNDSGLRSVEIKKIMNWKDSRWQPKMDNPNFIGVYRLAFLSH